MLRNSPLHSRNSLPGGIASTSHENFGGGPSAGNLMILIDSDVMIDVIRSFPPAAQWLQSVASNSIATPGYVMMEMIDGCHNKGELRQLEQVTAGMTGVWPSPASCGTALSNFRTLHLSHGLGLLDTLIGQTAIELGVPLHTFNVKHFQAVPALTTIQPYKK